MDETVAVADLSIFESCHVQHAIAIKGVILALGLKDRVFGVAQINTIDVHRNLTLQNFQVGRIDLLEQGSPGTLKIGVIAWIQIAGEGVHNVDAHLISNLITFSAQRRLS